VKLDVDPGRAELERQRRKLQVALADCKACPRTSPHPRYLWEGDPRAAVVFLVAAPHPGAPGVSAFAAPGGSLLPVYAATILPGSSTAILAATACLGPLPKWSAMEACRSLWGKYLELHRPRVVVALGARAHDALRPQRSFPEGRAKPEVVRGVVVGSTYHPAALPAGTTSVDGAVRADLERIRGCVDSIANRRL
jgi:uracil-DNA glycosylase